MSQNLASLLKNSLLGTLWCIAGVLLYFFLLHYGNYLRIVAQHPDSLLFMFYDWADTAFFSKVISEGMYESQRCCIHPLKRVGVSISLY